ncbi:MAG: Lrp/AsnC family transcriptional regulator [Geminicoccaceae bacterium]|nr:Lrp/AsnC family transcriptional regulator [Geminicoccaceae bacterium]
MIELDAADRRILELLQDHGRMTNAELADKAGVSASACHRRLRRLEEAGVIDSYRAMLNQAVIGRPTTIFVEITLASQSEDALDQFEHAVRDCRDVLECHLMAGNADFLLRVAASGPADFERIHRQQLTRLPGVARMRSSFVLRTIMAPRGLPLVNG